MIYNMFLFFKSLKFAWSHCTVISRKLLIRSRNQTILSISKWIGLFDKFAFQWYIVCPGKFRPSKIIRGGAELPLSLILQRCVIRATNHTTIVSIINSIMICIILCWCIGTISCELLKWKVEMHMNFENKLQPEFDCDEKKPIQLGPTLSDHSSPFNHFILPF